MQNTPLTTKRQRPKPHQDSALLEEIATPKRIYLRMTAASLKYGISRTRLFALIANGTLKSKLTIQPNAKRGVRLISAQSLEAYINSFGPEGKEETAL